MFAQTADLRLVPLWVVSTTWDCWLCGKVHCQSRQHQTLTTVPRLPYVACISTTFLILCNSQLGGFRSSLALFSFLSSFVLLLLHFSPFSDTAKKQKAQRIDRWNNSRLGVLSMDDWITEFSGAAPKIITDWSKPILQKRVKLLGFQRLFFLWSH